MKSIIERRNAKYTRDLARNERKFRHKLKDKLFRDELGLPDGMPQSSLDVIAKAQAMKHTKKPSMAVLSQTIH